jgi:hypothetical protein
MNFSRGIAALAPVQACARQPERREPFIELRDRPAAHQCERATGRFDESAEQ